MDRHRYRVIEKTIWLRLAQLVINEGCKNGDFLVPIHLALGHEALAVAVDAAMTPSDNLLLTHRNIHYNLARLGSLRPEIAEYYLRDSGIAKGRLGSMNLANPDRGIIYTSSILGNNLPVAAGCALANRAAGNDGVVIVVTGDGAIEEGAFYESLLFMKSNGLITIVLVENNEWSLGTRIEERRTTIDLSRFAAALDVEYTLLRGNDPFEYIDRLRELRKQALASRSPILIEATVTTFGYWYVETAEYPDGKFINYHAGPAPKVQLCPFPILGEDENDPLIAIGRYANEDTIREISVRLIAQLEAEVA